MKILGHDLELQFLDGDLYDDLYECKKCKIKYVHFSYIKDERFWRYIPSVKIGPIKLELTCEEQQIKNLLE